MHNPKRSIIIAAADRRISEMRKEAHWVARQNAARDWGKKRERGIGWTGLHWATLFVLAAKCATRHGHSLALRISLRYNTMRRNTRIMVLMPRCVLQVTMVLEHSLQHFIEMLAHGVLWLIQEGPGLGHTSHRISESLRLRVQIKILRGLATADIVQQNIEEFLDAYMSQQDGSVTDRILAAAQLAESKPPKDYFLNSTDVANIRRLLDKRDWLFSENPQENVVMWASQSKADVLYIEQQKPIPDTPDYAFLAGTTQAASTKSAAKQPGGSQPAASELRGSQPSGFQPGGSQPGGSQPAAPQPAAPHTGASQPGLAASGSECSHTAEEDCVAADAALEPAFTGADDDLSKPKSISLERDQKPHLVSQQGKSSKGKAINFNADNWTPISIAITQDCNVEAAIRWGHKRPLHLDYTHACNAQKFPLFTLVVDDDMARQSPLPSSSPAKSGQI